MGGKRLNNISKGKIAVGYALLLAVLLFSLFFVYREMGHLLSSEKNDFLKTDSLIVLLQKKDSNTVSLLHSLSEAHEGLIPTREVEQILALEDSTILRQRVQRKVISRRDTILTKQKKKGFFRRLGEVFVPPKKDTAIHVKSSLEFATDTLLDPYNPVDSLHEKLRGVTNKKKGVGLAAQHRSEVLQRFNETLTIRIDSLLRQYEQNALHKAHSEAELRQSVRQRSTLIVGCFAIGGILLSGIFLTLIWRDVTRSNQYRRKLEEANRKAEELLAARERLMLAITHDFKAPLGSIMGYAELLSRLMIDERQRFYLNNMKVSSEHLLKLVSDLLEFHRLDLHKVEIQHISFHPSHLLEEIKASFEPLAMSKGLYLHSEITPELENSFISDPLRLRQIVTNLLSNAIKFTDRGGITLHASLGGINDSSLLGVHLKIAISDTGKGMLPEDRERIFHEFTRLPGAQGEEGFGLGLSIVRMLIRLMQGTIEVESELGVGSRFIINIPVSRALSSADVPGEGLSVSNDAMGNASRDEVKPTAVATAMKVLLIDDDSIQLQLTSTMLAQRQITSVCCVEPQQLWDALQTETFDLLLTDIQMPAINGFDLLKLLRSSDIPQARSIPVVAVSARMDMNLSQLQEAGFSGCLNKPFTTDELIRLVIAIRQQSAQAFEFTKPSVSCETDASEGFDFSALTAFAEDDREATKSILESFISETRINVGRMQQALENRDTGYLADMAHKMLPLFTLLKASALVHILKELEGARRQPFTTEIETKGNASLEIIGSVLLEARKLLDKG